MFGDYSLEYGDYRAAITQVGAGLRELRHAGRDLVLSFDRDEARPYFRGSLLAPWPNRITDGRYQFAGQQYQLPVNETERATALHGLVCWVPFDLLEQTAEAVTLRHRLVPQPGYPFALELTARYVLGDAGLSCTVTATNVGDQSAPYGTAPHPYLCAGTGRVDDWTLEVPADEVLSVTPDRLLPVATGPVTSPVAGGPLDFRSPRRIGDVWVDHAYTTVTAGPDGLALVRLRHDDGHGVECAWDPTTLPWVQIHTADRPDEASSRLGLAVEPMTCPPDAFNSGVDLLVLRPGDQHVAGWTLAALTD